MRNKLYWGLGILIVLLIGAFSFVLVKEQSKIRQLETDLADLQKKREAHNEAANTPKVVDISDVKPPPAEPGFKWVRHGDHWDKIPVGQPETTVEPVKPPYTGPLTYHEELLKTNPVKALRLQAEERGHWSAKWILPFPPDDHEAANLAKCRYLIEYYKSTGERTNNPALKEVERIENTFLESLKEKYLPAREQAARYSDLLKLTWPSLDTPINHCELGLRSGYFPSEYNRLTKNK